MSAVTIDEIALAASSPEGDRPDPWTACGFVVEDRACQIGDVRVRFVDVQAGGPPPTGDDRDVPADDSPPAGGIVGWSLRGVGGVASSPEGDLDGLPTTVSDGPPRQAAPAHPNGVSAIDHVVVFSPDLDRTVAILQAAGLDLRRIREQPTPAGAPRQAFFRLGATILEVVQAAVERAGGRNRPARFWGLALLVEDIDAAAERFAPHVSEFRPAVQPGRRIATVRRSAGLGVPLALMSADERPPGGARESERAREGQAAQGAGVGRGEVPA